MTYRDAVEFMEQFEDLLKEIIANNKEGVVLTREYCMILLQALNTTAYKEDRKCGQFTL